jgi:hypothetical protein
LSDEDFDQSICFSFTKKAKNKSESKYNIATKKSAKSNDISINITPAQPVPDRGPTDSTTKILAKSSGSTRSLFSNFFSKKGNH